MEGVKPAVPLVGVPCLYSCELLGTLPVFLGGLAHSYVEEGAHAPEYASYSSPATNTSEHHEVLDCLSLCHHYEQSVDDRRSFHGQA